MNIQCKCEWPVDSKWIECTRHKDAEGNPLRKYRRDWELCVMGLKGEEPGLAYFLAWEEDRGSGQTNAEPINPKPPLKLPPVREQVSNFLKAFARLAGDSFRCVGQEEFDRRVEICMACELFIRRSGRCSKCGCYGSLKARGRVWECPIRKWLSKALRATR